MTTNRRSPARPRKAPKTPPDAQAVARVQSATAKANDGKTPKGSLASRLQRAVDKRG